VRSRPYGAKHTRIDQIIDIDQSGEEELNKNYVSASKSASTLLGGCVSCVMMRYKMVGEKVLSFVHKILGGFDTTIRVDS